MSIEEQLKAEILSRYRSVRAFTTAVDIPYSTLDSVFKRGISNAGVLTMIKVFSALDLDIESIQTGTLQRVVPPSSDTSKKAPSILQDGDSEMLGLYHKLDNRDQGRVLGYMDHLLESEKYKEDAV